MPVSDLPIRFDAVGFTAGTTAVLTAVSTDIAAGPPTVLMGPNGSGKTTLLKLAMTLITPTQGRVSFADHATPRSHRRAFVFQKPVMLRRSVAANIAFALNAAGRRADETVVAALLDQVGLSALGARPARRLSGGEQQRLALARALARDPEILYLDEPTASLDVAATKAVEDIIRNIAAAGVKVVMATHDIGQARRLAGDVIFLAKGRLIEHTAAPQFFVQPMTDDARRFIAGELIL